MILLEFNKYKMEKSHLNDDYTAVSGLLWIHLLAGRGLRAITTISPLAGILGFWKATIFVCINYNLYS